LIQQLLPESSSLLAYAVVDAAAAAASLLGGDHKTELLCPFSRPLDAHAA
jgi:hypothetical protein